MKKAWVLSYPLSAQRRLWSDWADTKADLSLRWAHSHLVGFVMARLIFSRLTYVTESQGKLCVLFHISDIAYSLHIQQQLMCLNPYVTNGLSHHYHLDESIFNFRGIRGNFHFYFIFHWNSCKQTVKPRGVSSGAILCAFVPKIGRQAWMG